MKLSKESFDPLTKYAGVIMRHYAIISVIVLFGALFYCLISIQQVLQLSEDADYRETQSQKNTKTSFDQATIQKVKDLKTSNDQFNQALPEGRINPFAE